MFHVTAVSAAGVSVFYPSHKLLHWLPSHFQNQLQPACQRFLVTNRTENSVWAQLLRLGQYHTSNRRQQQFFMLTSSEADCLVGLEFLENHHLDGFFFGKWRPYLNSETILSFRRRKPTWKRPTYNVRVVAQETTVVTASNDAVILFEFTNQTFPGKYEGFFELSRILREMPFVSSESEDTIPARVFKPVEVTVCKCTHLRSISRISGSKIAALSQITVDLPDGANGSTLEKSNTKEVCNRLSLPWIHQIMQNFARLHAYS